MTAGHPRKVGVASCERLLSGVKQSTNPPGAEGQLHAGADTRRLKATGCNQSVAAYGREARWEWRLPLWTKCSSGALVQVSHRVLQGHISRDLHKLLRRATRAG